MHNKGHLRWRHRQQWLLLAGDAATVDRWVPDLSTAGYAVTADAVLLYAGTGSLLEVEWLKQLRRLRRYRPLDAVVAVVSANTTRKPAFDADVLGYGLSNVSEALGWAAPTYVLNVAEVTGAVPAAADAVACLWSGRALSTADLHTRLSGLARQMAAQGVLRIAAQRDDRYLAQLSSHVTKNTALLSVLVEQLRRAHSSWRTAVHGVLLAPLFSELDNVVLTAHASPTGASIDTAASLLQPTWQAIAAHSRRVHGRRVGWSVSTVAAWCVSALACLWIAGTVISGLNNRAMQQEASATLAQLATPQEPGQAMHSLNNLQKQIDTLEYRGRERAPWLSRFGLNRDTALLAALWPHYAQASRRILIDPMRLSLSAQLRQLSTLSDKAIVGGGDARIKSAYATLKTYLMMGNPTHVDAAFLTPQLLTLGLPARVAGASVSAGEWRDWSQQGVRFYVDHLASTQPGGVSLAVEPDIDLVNAARQTLLGVIGLQNSTDVVYQQILDESRSKYPAVSLQTLLGNSSSDGLFSTRITVAGVFTRAAWDERIGKAIDAAEEQRSVAGDWVLTDAKGSAESLAKGDLIRALRQRYFTDFADAWQKMLNSIRWQPDNSLSGTIDQLTLLADPQRSPLSALMKVIVYQAGTGTTTQSLSDSLVSRAQHLVGAAKRDPAQADPSQAKAPLQAPLAEAFSPLLRLAGSDLASTGASPALAAGGSSDLSLARDLERVSAVRLKLQQIMMSPDPDAMSRRTAQAILQGKTSDLGDSRDYAARVAASVGEQWSGFGDELFQRPLDQTWDVILKPAATSLNDTWRSSVVAAWDKTFTGRYPFADSDNDASLPELARFLRPDSGMIAQFVSTQLGGILERQGDQWVVSQNAGRNALNVDAAFITKLNLLTQAANVAFPNGDAGLRYELRAVPTSGITDMTFRLSGNELHYFNQTQEWTPFIWPGTMLENNTRVEWQTAKAGLRATLNFEGRFGLIRLLERAKVTQQDSARYVLQWTPDAGTGLPLQVQLRSEAGSGPLELLQLRHFSLPTQIFVARGPAAPASKSPPSPSPSKRNTQQHANELLQQAFQEIDAQRRPSAATGLRTMPESP